MKKLVVISCGIASWGISTVMFAQTIPFKRPGDERPNVDKSIETPEQKPQLSLPPIEELPGTTPVPGIVKFKLSGFEFEGNSVYSDDELNALLKDYLGRSISTMDLERIRLAVTNHYVENGYINSGALIPDQNLENNILKLNIVEGRLTTINLENQGRLDPQYIGERISPDPKQPLNISQLQERLYVLQQNPRIKRINAALGPGVERGESILDIRVSESKPYSLAVEFNNHRPTSVGEKQGEVQFNHLNLSGAGDSLEVIYDGTEGLNYGSLLYNYPIAANDTTLNIGLDYADTKVVEEEFKSLDLHSDYWSVNTGFTYPLYQSPHDVFSMEFQLARRHSESYLGPTLISCHEFGGCDVTALRLIQSWLSHSANEVFAFRHVLSMGLNAFNATIAKDEDQNNNANELMRDGVIADSRYTSWLLQLQWARRYRPLGLQSIFRSDLQIAFDPLLSMEQFAIGGANSVRGYRENQYISDNGLTTSLEFRLPIFKANKQEVQTMLFYDYGQSWDEGDHMDKHILNSAGVGLRYHYTDWVAAQVYWGKQLKEIESDGSEWQDQGIHAAIRVNVL